MDKSIDPQQQPPEKSSSFKKGDIGDKSSAAEDTTLPAENSSSSNQQDPNNPNNENNKPPPATAEEVVTTDQSLDKDKAAEESNKEEDKDKEKKEGEEEGEAEAEAEAAEPPPPEVEYTLELASEDVERFLSSLPSAPKQEEAGATTTTNTITTTPTDQEEGAATATETETATEPATATEIEIPDFLEKYLDLVEQKLSKLECPDAKLKDDASSFLDAVDRISKLYKRFSTFAFKLASNQVPVLTNRIGGIQQRAMAYLEDEFRSLLEDTKSLEAEQKQEAAAAASSNDQDQPPPPAAADDQSSNDPDSNFPGYSQTVLDNMTRIAKEMISGGFESECCEIYMIHRRNVIEEILNKIGFEKISMDEVQKMQWDTLEREIPSWIKAFKQCAKVYFPAEHKLAKAVFADYPSMAEGLFSNITRGVVIQLLNFGEAVAVSKRSTEKLFKFLDIYETLRDNLPLMDCLFPEECAKELRAESVTTRCRIGETAICIFSDLENSIKTDTGKNSVPGGAVHPLTRYTMNYLKYACEYKDTLEQVFKEHSKIERADSTSRPRNYEGEATQNYNDQENTSPFAAQLMRIMDLLDHNLETKSKLYKDVSLSCIFMMNNGRYMLQKIKGSAEIHHVMGDTWCRKRSSDLRNYHKSYQRETWTKLLGCLTHEGLNVNGKVVKPVLKERFKSFNAMFDEIHKTQGQWVVSDEQLQSELRVSISAVVIPAYRSFLGRFSGYLDPGRQTEKYIKFQPEDIETYIDELFDGNPSSMARRRT